MRVSAHDPGEAVVRHSGKWDGPLGRVREWFLIRKARRRIRGADAGVRASGVGILRDLGTPRADECLVALLESGSEDLRRATLSALVERRCPLAIPPAITLLAGPDEALRDGALDGLPRIDPAWANTAAAREAFTTLAGRLAAVAPRENLAVTARALALIDPTAAVPNVLPLLVHESPAVREAALQVLEDHSPNWRTSEAASAAFARFAERLDLAQGGDALIRAQALLTINPRQAISPLVGLLVHRDEGVRLNALQRPRAVTPGWASESASAGIFKELARLATRDHPARTVIFAARLLMEIDPSQAIPELLTLLPGCDAEVFEMILSELGPPERYPAAEAHALIARAEKALEPGNHDHVRQQAVKLLLAAGPGGTNRLIGYCEAARPKPTMIAREKAFLTHALAEIPTHVRGIHGLSDLKACLRLAFLLEDKHAWDFNLSVIPGLAEELAGDPQVRARGLDVVAGGDRKTPWDRPPEDAAREAIIQALQGAGFSTPGYVSQLLGLAGDEGEDKFVRHAAIMALGAEGPREELSDLICRLLERGARDLLTAASVEAARLIGERRAVAPMRRLIAGYAREARTRFLAVRCLVAIFDILGTEAVGETAFLLDNTHLEFNYPYVSTFYKSIGMPTPVKVESRYRSWLEEQRRAMDPDRYVESLVDKIHEARKTGHELAVVAAADTVKLRLVDNKISLNHFLMVYHKLRYRVSDHEPRYIPLSTRELASMWGVGGFWRSS